MTAHSEETMATWKLAGDCRGGRFTLHSYLKFLLNVNVPLEGWDGRVEPPALDEDGAAPVLVRVDPRVGGQEGAAPASQQGRPRVADGRDLGDARSLGQEEGPAEGGLLGGQGEAGARVRSVIEGEEDRELELDRDDFVRKVILPVNKDLKILNIDGVNNKSQ